MRKILCLGLTILVLTGCTTTQQPDGSTRVGLSLGNALGLRPKEAPTSTPSAADLSANKASAGDATQKSPATVAPRAQAIPLANAPRLSSTPLASIFRKHPYDGSPKTHFPRVAVTVTDWSRGDCWSATAMIWWSKSKSEAVPSFSVCWGQSVGYAVNNAANLHLFMQQSAVDHSGNVRTTGPRPPMFAVPDRQPINERQQLAFQGFIQQLVIDTGWQPGAPTNLWLVGYDTNAANSPSAAHGTATEAVRSMDVKGKAQLEQALACVSIGRQFDPAEAVLKQSGWQSDQGITPATLSGPINVYGFSSRKIAVSRDGGEQTYSTYLSGISLQQLVKAASLKLGKDGKTFGRVTKIGVLSAGLENGEITLTCTVNTEGSEG